MPGDAQPLSLVRQVADLRKQMRRHASVLTAPSDVTAATTYLLDKSSAMTLATNTPTWLVFTRATLIDEATATEGSPNTAPYSDALISLDGTNPEVTVSKTGLWYWTLLLNQSTSTNTTDPFKIYGNSPANTIGTRMTLSKDPTGSGATSAIWGCDWVNSWFGSPSFTVAFNVTWTGGSSIGNIDPQLYLARVT
jgi:hypothetical protein